MLTNRKSKWGEVALIVLCSFLVLLIMRPWQLYFLNDDYQHIPRGNLIVRENFLRPVSNFFIAGDKWLFGKEASGYFITTFILHTLCSISIYLLSRQVLHKYQLKLPASIPLLTSIIFLFYPFHAEPLFWIISRVSIIAALFTILSLYYYLRTNEHQKFLVLSWVTFLVALFTYESIWNVLLFYCLVSFINVRLKLTTTVYEIRNSSIFLITFLVYLIIRFLSLNTLTGGYEEIDNNIKNFSFLLLNLVKLVGRNFTPPFYNQYYSISFFTVSVIVYAYALVKMLKRDRAIGLLMIILLAGVITGVITATPLGIDTHRNESERFIYYSSFFFCFFISTATTLAKVPVRIYTINTAIIIAGIAGLTVYQRNYAYASTVTKNTLQFIGKYPQYKKAYFIDVPEEYRGALIFRVCLPYAIDWIEPSCKYDSVTIVTKVKEAAGIRPFETGVKTWDELSIAKNKNAQKGIYALKDSSNRYIRLNDSDVVFWYTKTGLFKVNKP